MSKTEEDKIDRLVNVMSVQSKTTEEDRMRTYVRQYVQALNDAGHNIVIAEDKGNIYLTKGVADVYPCMVAHMDTVHKIVNEFAVYQSKDNLFGFDEESCEQAGIGGDDKVGVFILLEMLASKSAIKCALFCEEESGCNGSRRANLAFFDNTGYLIQCDRRGHTEIIKTGSGLQLFSDEFEKIIEQTIKSYDYITATGSITDVVELKKNNVDVCAMNVGCGYYNPHTSKEYVSITDVLKCLDMVGSLIDVLGNKKYPYIGTRAVTAWDDYYGTGRLYLDTGAGFGRQSKLYSGLNLSMCEIHGTKKRYTTQGWECKKCNKLLKKINIYSTYSVVKTCIKHNEVPKWNYELSGYVCTKCIEEHTKKKKDNSVTITYVSDGSGKCMRCHKHINMSELGIAGRTTCSVCGTIHIKKTVTPQLIAAKLCPFCKTEMEKGHGAYWCPSCMMFEDEIIKETQALGGV